MCFLLSFLHLKNKWRVSWPEDTAVLVPSVPVCEERSGLGFYFYKHRLWRQELSAPKQPLRELMAAALLVSMLHEKAGQKVSEDTVLSHIRIKQLLCFCAKPVPVEAAPDFSSLNKLWNLPTPSASSPRGTLLRLGTLFLKSEHCDSSVHSSRPSWPSLPCL